MAVCPAGAAPQSLCAKFAAPAACIAWDRGSFCDWTVWDEKLARSGGKGAAGEDSRCIDLGKAIVVGPGDLYWAEGWLLAAPDNW